MPIVPNEFGKQELDQKKDVFTAVEPVSTGQPNKVMEFADTFDEIGSITVDYSKDMEKQAEVSRLAIASQDEYGKSPSQAAEILKLSQKTGLPSQYVSENFDDLKRESDLSSFDVETFKERNPKLASFVAQDPNHFTLLKEDIDKFREIENRGGVAFGWDNATLQREKSQLIGKRWNGTSTEADRKRLAEIDRAISLQSKRVEGESFFDTVKRTAGYTARQVVDSTGSVLQGAATGAVTGAAAGAVAAPATAGGSILVGAGAGLARGALMGGILDTYEMEANFAYDELTKARDEFGNSIDDDTAKWVARGIGAVNSVIETAGDLFVLTKIPGLNKLVDKATGKVRKDLSQMAARALAQPSTRTALLQSAQAVVQGGGAEALTEFSQNLVGFTGQQVAEGISGIDTGETFGDAVSQGALEGYEAFLGTVSTLGLAHGSARFYQHSRAIKNGEANARFFDAIAQGVQSKAFQALPEKGQEAVRAAIADGAGEVTYFQSDAWDAYWKAKGLDPRAVALEVNQDGGSSYDQAFESGGFVKVPTERVGRKLLANDEHKDLMLDATVSPDRETPRQAQEAEAELRREIEELKNTTEKKDSAASKVEAIITEQLKNSKAKGDVKKQAQLFAKIAENLSKESGIDAEQLINKYGLSIQRPDQVKRVPIDELDPLIDQIRSPKEEKIKAKSLVDFLAEKGGVNLSGQGGDLRFMEVNKSRGRFKKALSKKTGMDIDKAAELAAESGYLKARDPVALLDAIDKEIRGEPVYAQGAEPSLSDKAFELQMLSDTIGRLGVDLTTTDNATIKQLLKNSTETTKDQPSDFFEFMQGKPADARGRIRFGKNKQATIDLFEKADLTTFLHESAHFWLEVMGDIAESEQGGERIKKIYADTLNFLGVKNRSDIKVEHHEMFAEAFEKYLGEGKAPSLSLQDAFNSFKAWVLWVYRSLTNLDVKLTDEVRSVFDRMIATDEEIARVREAQEQTPLILDPIMAGLNEKDADKYARLVAEAREYASSRIMERHMAQVKRERSKIWKDEEAQVREQVEKEVDAMPDQVLLRMLRTGKMEGLSIREDRLKLSRAALVEAYGAEFTSRLPRYVFGADGFDHNELASILGLESGWQLVEMIANAQDREALIKQRVKAEMESRHGSEDVYLNGKLPESVMQEIHNDKNAERMLMEYEYLMQNRTKDSKTIIKAVTKRPPNINAVKLKAERMVREMQSSDIKPHVFLRAERKHAKDARDLMLKGDFEGALQSKKKEILNHELYRQAEKAKERIQKFEADFNKFFQEDEKLAKRYDINEIKVGRAILAGFGFGDDDGVSPEGMLRDLKEYAPEEYEVRMLEVNTALENADYYMNLSFEKLEALHTIVKGYWNRGRVSKQIMIDGKKIELAQAKEDLLNAMSLVPKNQTEQSKRLTKDEEEASSFWLTLGSRTKRMESVLDAWDAYANGTFKAYLFNSVRESTEKYKQAQSQVFQKLNAHLQKYKDRFGGPEIVAESLGYTFKNKNELLGALIHTGNDSNFKRLLVGRDWGSIDESGQLDSSRWDQFLQFAWSNNILTEDDYKLVQGVWDILEEMKADTQKAYYEINGYYFNEIENKRIKTPFGEFKGGYVPATPDKSLSFDGDIRMEKQQLDNNFHLEMPSRNDGFTKSRVQNYATPLMMDLQIVTAHIDSALKFTYITPRVKEVARLLHDRELRAELNRFDPNFVKNVAMPFLIKAASQTTTVSSENKHFDRFIGFMRRNAAAQTMFVNIPNTLQQISNFIPAALKVKPKYLLNSFVSLTTRYKEGTKMIAEKSLFMRNQFERLGSKAALETENLLKDRNAFEQGGVWLERNAYISQVHFQNVLSANVWLASYDQSIANGLSELDAVRQADSDVRATQGSMSAEDTSAVETGTPLKRALMMFYGFFNAMQNLYQSEWARAGALKGSAKTARRAEVVGNFIVFSFVGKAIIDSARGKFGEDDEDKDLAFWLKYTMGSAFDLISPMLGIAGQAVQVAKKNLLNEADFGNRISVSPLISGPENMIQKVTKSKDFKAKDAMSMMAYAPLMSFVPVSAVPGLNRVQGLSPAVAALSSANGYAGLLGTLKRPVGYIEKVAEGKESPQDAVDVAQGLVTGRGKAPR